MRQFEILSEILTHSARQAQAHCSKLQQFYAEQDTILDLEGACVFIKKGRSIRYATTVKNKSIKVIAGDEVRVEVREGWKVVVSVE